MRRSLFFILLIVAVLFAGAATVWLAAPKLAPTYLAYDLIGRHIAPLPADVEQFVIQSGDAFCARGHDSACGGYKIVDWHSVASDPNAWCIDYVTLRRNLGRSGNLIYWAKIPDVRLIRRSGGGYEAIKVNDCHEGNTQ